MPSLYLVVKEKTKTRLNEFVGEKKVLKEVLYKIYKNPLGLLKRALFKTLIAPFKYRKGTDYDAQKYWHDRFSKYGKTLTASGDEGLSEEENRRDYERAVNTMKAVFRNEDIDFEQTQALEIGCGTGFYTQLLQDLKVKSYTGADITDVLFPELRQKFPDSHFIQKDVTTEEIIEPPFDLIIMIDVIEHIVSKEKLAFALKNVQRCLKKKGVFIISPIMEISKKHLFYLHSWQITDIRENFPDDEYLFRALMPFRQSTLLVIKKL